MPDATLRLDFGVVPEPDEPAVADRSDEFVGLRPQVPFNWSEDYRHACEVRFVVSKGRAWAVEFCRAVADKRGRAPAEKLWIDARREAKRVGAWLKP
jgi:hypothetical protein